MILSWQAGAGRDAYAPVRERAEQVRIRRMDSGDLLTRLTIWCALIAYTGGQVGRGGRWPAFTEQHARLLWSIGCLLYLAHVVAAFQWHYDWSHGVAYDATAAQTEALAGVAWGGGIVVNYLFTLAWIVEAGTWWVAPVAYRARPRWLGTASRALFLFMIVNGAVLFVDGPMRWVGLVVVGVLLATWRKR